MIFFLLLLFVNKNPTPFPVPVFRLVLYRSDFFNSSSFKSVGVHVWIFGLVFGTFEPDIIYIYIYLKSEYI